jgi:hypothetical protein
MATRRYQTQVWVYLFGVAEVNNQQGVVTVWNDTAEQLIAQGKAQRLSDGLLLKPIEKTAQAVPVNPEPQPLAMRTSKKKPSLIDKILSPEAPVEDETYIVK